MNIRSIFENSKLKALSIEEVLQVINQQLPVVLAGSEKALSQLPTGNWIGATIPYFMNNNGACKDNNSVFLFEFIKYMTNFKIKSYTEDTISNVFSDRYNNGFSVILAPCFSSILAKYAIEAEANNKIFDTPIIGFVSGIALEDVSSISPKVFNGTLQNKISENEIIAMHIEISDEYIAGIEILNIFEEGDGDVITFNNEGFECENCFINGIEKNFAEYIVQNNIDTKLPLVANYSGAKINISFQNVDSENKKVLFYAPVRTNTEYRIAKQISDYQQAFANKINTTENETVLLSCNCILNYLYCNLNGKTTGKFNGPFTFGEIAYVLVNQTLAYLKIEKRN